ncbi:MAG: hypothetical protein IKL89_01705 [Clostridia bacterium]|nr:hypothetical protein [Clostridia bacterium]
MAGSAANIGLRSADRRMRELTIQSPGAGGLVLEELEENLAPEQCAELCNVWFRGDVLARRPGQERITSTEGGRIGSLWHRQYGGKCIYTAEGALWARGESTERLCWLEGPEEGCFFLFGGKLYFLNGRDYLVYDGKTAAPVEPYVPEISRDRAPDGSAATPAEPMNLLGDLFAESFCPDGTATAFSLSRGGLAGVVSVTAAGTALSEGTDYEVDCDLGQVILRSAPAAGENTLCVVARRQTGVLPACRRAAVFGGEGKMRVIFGANGAAEYFWSEAFDPAYIPENNRAVLGDGSEDITAFGEQYNRLIVFTAGEVWCMEADTKGFTVTPINRTVGCDAPETVCLVGNRLVWLNTGRGVCTLLSTSLSAEKNVQPISRNIDGNDRRPGLLSEPGLGRAAACEWKGYYILSVGDRCYLWDARRTPYIHSSDTRRAQGALAWYRWTDIRASRFCHVGDELWYAAEESLCRFYARYIDFGKRFRSSIRVPLRDFGFPDRLKNVLYAYVTVRGDVNNCLTAACVTEREAAGTPIPRDIRAVSFDLAHWDLADFTLEAVNFRKTVRLRPHRRRVMLFGMEISCELPDREMNVCSVTYRYRTVGQMK